jgi:serine/threonine protein kinase
MNALDHPNVVKQISYGEGTHEKNGQSIAKKFIAIELCQGGELFDFVCHGGPFSERVARYYFHQFMDGLSYCHS